MTKKIILAAVALSLLARGTYAQDTPKADVSAGYSLLHINGLVGTPGTNMNGFSGSAAYNVNEWLSGVADFGLYHGTTFQGASMSAETYTFGPRIALRTWNKFVPFAQALFGISHASSSFQGSSSSKSLFVYGFGGGADIGFAKGGKVALRPQFEYLGFDIDLSSQNVSRIQNSERFSLGIVYNFGKK